MDQEKTSRDDVSFKASDVMVKEVVMIDEDASVKEAVDKMNRADIGSIIVARNGEPMGIITERDLLKRIIAEGKNADTAKAKDIMSSPLTFISSNVDLGEAAKVMFKKKIKKLPVIDGKRMVGLLSLTDIARCQHITKMLASLAARRNTPKSIKRIVDYYIV
jgi:CBS domain-containing protein